MGVDGADMMNNYSVKNEEELQQVAQLDEIINDQMINSNISRMFQEEEKKKIKTNIDDGENSFSKSESGTIRLCVTTSGNETGTPVLSSHTITVANQKYREWGQKDVLLWLKSILLESKINTVQVEEFLAEFSNQCITGAMLVTLSQDPKIVEQLKSQFSKKNQVFGIWLIVESAITSLKQ